MDAVKTAGAQVFRDTKAAQTAASVLSFLVEAVGVEPTSEKRVAKAFTCVAFYLKSRRTRVGRRHLARRPALL
jgi:hypothetical protein